MIRGLCLAFDPGDFQLGKVVAESDRFVESLATLEFESDAFFAAVLFDDLSGDSGSVNSRSSHLGVGTVVHEENFAELDLVTSGHGKFVDTDGVAFLHSVLLTAGFENCVGHE